MPSYDNFYLPAGTGPRNMTALSSQAATGEEKQPSLQNLYANFATNPTQDNFEVLIAGLTRDMMNMVELVTQLAQQQPIANYSAIIIINAYLAELNLELAQIQSQISKGKVSSLINTFQQIQNRIQTVKLLQDALLPQARQGEKKTAQEALSVIESFPYGQRNYFTKDQFDNAFGSYFNALKTLRAVMERAGQAGDVFLLQGDFEKRLQAARDQNYWLDKFPKSLNHSATPDTGMQESIRNAGGEIAQLNSATDALRSPQTQQQQQQEQKQASTTTIAQQGSGQQQPQAEPKQHSQQQQAQSAQSVQASPQQPPPDEKQSKAQQEKIKTALQDLNKLYRLIEVFIQNPTEENLGKLVNFLGGMTTIKIAAGVKIAVAKLVARNQFASGNIKPAIVLLNGYLRRIERTHDKLQSEKPTNPEQIAQQQKKLAVLARARAGIIPLQQQLAQQTSEHKQEVKAKEAEPVARSVVPQQSPAQIAPEQSSPQTEANPAEVAATQPSPEPEHKEPVTNTETSPPVDSTSSSEAAPPVSPEPSSQPPNSAATSPPSQAPDAEPLPDDDASQQQPDKPAASEDAPQLTQEEKCRLKFTETIHRVIDGTPMYHTLASYIQDLAQATGTPLELDSLAALFKQTLKQAGIDERQQAKLYDELVYNEHARNVVEKTPALYLEALRQATSLPWQRGRHHIAAEQAKNSSEAKTVLQRQLVQQKTLSLQDRHHQQSTDVQGPTKGGFFKGIMRIIQAIVPQIIRGFCVARFVALFNFLNGVSSKNTQPSSGHVNSSNYDKLRTAASSQTTMKHGEVQLTTATTNPHHEANSSRSDRHPPPTASA